VKKDTCCGNKSNSYLINFSFSPKISGMKKQILSVITVLLVLAGATMLYLGFASAPKILWPPVVTGFGFFIIAAGFWVSK